MKSGKKQKHKKGEEKKRKWVNWRQGQNNKNQKKKKKKRTSPGQTSFSALVLPWLPHVDRAAVTSPTDQA